MKTALQWIVNNWSIIIAMVALIVVIVIAIIQFVKLPVKAQISKVKNCLLGWVIEAERNLGGGTGRVKLSTVYGWFVTTFPIVKNFISFETFSILVDEALDEMRQMLEENKNLKQVVEGCVLLSEESTIPLPLLSPDEDEGPITEETGDVEGDSE